MFEREKASIPTYINVRVKICQNEKSTNHSCKKYFLDKTLTKAKTRSTHQTKNKKHL